MSNVVMNKGTLKDIAFIIKNLREDDDLECLANGGLRSTEDKIVEAYNSPNTEVVYVDGTPVALMGYHDDDKGKRWVWMVGTTGLDKYKLTFFRTLKSQLATWSKESGRTLTNHVWVHNPRHIEALRAAGCAFHDKKRNSRTGEQFVRFTYV